MMNCPSSIPTFLSDIFDREINELRWIAETITGDAQNAETCISSARSGADGSPYVAPGWRDIWIKRCVAREAINRLRPEIASFTPNRHSSATDCALVWDKTALRSLYPTQICEVLNAFERAALIFHVYLGFSVQDCALLLECHWSSIEPACSAALWRLLGPTTHAQQAAVAGPLEAVA